MGRFLASVESPEEYQKRKQAEAAQNASVAMESAPQASPVENDSPKPRALLYGVNDFTPNLGTILANEKEVKREYDAHQMEHIGQQWEPTSEEREKLSAALMLRNDDKLRNKEKEKILKAAPYLSAPMKQRIQEYGGYGKTLKTPFREMTPQRATDVQNLRYATC